MSTAIFNREDFKHPEDRWYQVEVKGIHPNREAGIEQVIDDTACNAIVNRFNTDADAGKLPQGHELLIDHEHFKEQPDQETVAYGWLQRLQARADGIYGQIRWTAIGQAAVDGGNYRFFSSEYDRKDVVHLGGTPPRIRPMRLDGLTLTNMPNNKGGKPITNRASTVLNRLPKAQNPEAAARGAARLIAQLADAEQRSSGCTLGQAWGRVINREPQLHALAGGTFKSGQLPVRAPEVQEAPADFAARMLLQFARERPFPGFSQNLTLIRNRFPGLARMANREAGWDALADLEPAARAEYLQAKANPGVFASRLDDAKEKLRSRFPGLCPEERARKLEEIQPQVMSQYRLEQAASNPRFEAVMQGIIVEFPDLGFEGRWEKMKELYPKAFWKFVLDVGSKLEQAP
jgi:Mu-like prophage I protein